VVWWAYYNTPEVQFSTGQMKPTISKGCFLHIFPLSRFGMRRHALWGYFYRLFTYEATGALLALLYSVITV